MIITPIPPPNFLHSCDCCIKILNFNEYSWEWPKASSVPLVPKGSAGADWGLSCGQDKQWTVIEADSCVHGGKGEVDLPGCLSAPAALREIDREMQPLAVDRGEVVPIFWLGWGCLWEISFPPWDSWVLWEMRDMGRWWQTSSSWAHWRTLCRGGGTRDCENSGSGETIKGIQFNHQASFWNPWQNSSQLPATWPWARNFPSLGLSFLIYKNKKHNKTLRGCLENPVRKHGLLEHTRYSVLFNFIF